MPGIGTKIIGSTFVVGPLAPPITGLVMYQQVDWQVIKFDWTGGSGDPDDVTVKFNGRVAERDVYRDPEDPADQYSISPTPFEIKTGTELLVEFSATVGDVPDDSTVQLVDPATLSTATQYCSVYDVYKLFGSENVNKWADLNNVRNVAEIAEAIIDQIVQASDYINAKMRNKYYAVPFASPYPLQIVEIARIWAGTNLQVNRGIEDQDDTFDAKRMRAETLLKQILGKQIILNATGENEDPPAGSIPDAPSDGTQYVRRDANWVGNAVPKGGTAEQHLAKASTGTDYLCAWVDPPPAFTENNLWQVMTYDYDKRSNIIVPDTYVTIGQVVTPTRPAGLYEVKFSISYTFADTNDSAYVRFRINGGAWYEFVSEPRDATDRIGATYFFPYEQDTNGIQDIELEMRKEDPVASTLTCDFSDVIYQRVGGGTPAVNP